MGLWQKITARSWEHAGETEGIHGDVGATQPAKRVALRVFLAVVGSVFFLLFVAYRIRMELADWQPLPLPSILWFNTALLIAASIAMQYTRGLAQKESAGTLKAWMITCGLLTAGFIAGQVVAWTQLGASGYGLRANPANAFFYLLTAIHGLHMLGGLWVWFRATVRVLGGGEVESVRLSVQLCATYWHFLLLVWFVMFYFLLTT